METKVVVLTQISKENIESANTAILEMVSRRKLVIEGDLPSVVPTKFNSKSETKKFQVRLGGVLKHATMKRVNTYFSMYAKLTGTSKTSIEYSDREKAIRAARKSYREAAKVANNCLAVYREIKGDFYKS